MTGSTATRSGACRLPRLADHAARLHRTVDQIRGCDRRTELCLTFPKAVAPWTAMTFADSEFSKHTAQLVDVVDQIVRQSGYPTGFDAWWVTQLLDAPSPALDGRSPRELMHTSEGRATVCQLVRQMQTGAYA